MGAQTWGDLVLVPEATYEATYVGHVVERCFGEGKLGIRFRLITLGEQFEKELMAWYRVRALSLKDGKFSCSRHSKFAREWRLLFRRGADRWDRVPMTALRDITVLVKTHTVTLDYERQPLDPVNHYSVIECIVGRVLPSAP